MDQQCHESCLRVVSNGEKTSLEMMKNSLKFMMKIKTNHTSFKLVLSTPKNCRFYTVIFHSYLKELKFKNVRNLDVICSTRKTKSYT